MIAPVCHEDPAVLAGDLLSHYRTLGAVLAADGKALTRLFPRERALARHLPTIRAAHLSVLRDKAFDRPLLSNLAALAAYLRQESGHDTAERSRILFLDNRNRLIADEVFGLGSVGGAPIFPREVVKRALEIGASALILVHNHPSGDPRPTADDLATTRAIEDASRLFQITVHDHLIVARAGWLSLRQNGWA